MPTSSGESQSQLSAKPGEIQTSAKSRHDREVGTMLAVVQLSALLVDEL
jgi:hypothetical protein